MVEIAPVSGKSVLIEDWILLKCCCIVNGF